MRGARRTRRALLISVGLLLVVFAGLAFRSYRYPDPLHRSLADRVVSLDQVPDDPTLEALDEAHRVMNATIWGGIGWTPHVAADEACTHLTAAARTAQANGSGIASTIAAAIRELRDYTCNTPPESVSLGEVHDETERLYRAAAESLSDTWPPQR